MRKPHCLLISLLVLAACSDNTSLRFTDVTEEAGIDFLYTFGDTTYVNIMESSGGGVTVFDYDTDGFLDLYFLNGTYLEGISSADGKRYRGSIDRLYRNLGDGRFADVTSTTGLGDTLWSMAAGPVDLDRDGDQDLFLINYGPNRFFRNDGGRFVDITSSLGLSGPDSLNGFPKWSAGVVFWDENRDGLTDMMVCNFMGLDPSITAGGFVPHPNQFPGQASTFYLQDRNGRFIDATSSMNLHYPDSKCMGLAVFDYDQDGDTDLFQANDHQMNYLFRNDGGVYTDAAAAAGVAANDVGKPTGAMHGSLGDIDGDGRLDLLVVDLEYGALYRNRGNGTFEDITRRSGIATALTGKGAWASELFDYDNDGDLDLFTANGSGESFERFVPLLLENDGTGRYSDVGPKLNPYFSQKRSGRGAATFDYDNDGDLDLVVSHVDLPGKPILLRNDGGNRNHWLGVTLVDDRGPAAATGASVTVWAEGRRITSVNQPASGYLSYRDPRIHFGLGKANKIDSLMIRWPEARPEVFRNVPVNRYVTLRRGSGIADLR